MINVVLMIIYMFDSDQYFASRKRETRFSDTHRQRKYIVEILIEF